MLLELFIAEKHAVYPVVSLVTELFECGKGYGLRLIEKALFVNVGGVGSFVDNQTASAFGTFLERQLENIHIRKLAHVIVEQTLDVGRQRIYKHTAHTTRAHARKTVRKRRILCSSKLCASYVLTIPQDYPVQTTATRCRKVLNTANKHDAPQK